MTRKLVSLMLALVLLLTCTAALAEVTYPIAAETIKLNYWCSLHSNARVYISSYDENEAYQAIEKNTGIDLSFIHPAAGQEKVDFQLMMTDIKTLPDIIQYDSFASVYDGGFEAAMDEGIILDLTDLLPLYAPDYWALVKDDPLFQTADGRYAAVYKTNFGPYDGAWQKIITRKDFLEEWGKPEPDTLAELEDYFQWILDNKPGVIPFTLPIASSSCWFLIQGTFGFINSWYVDETGTVQWGYAAGDAYKAYLETMNRWYEKGYLSKDYTTYVENDYKSGFAAGTIATMMGSGTDMRTMATAAGFEAQTLPFIKLDENTMHHFDALNNPNQGNPAVITANCKNVEAALKFLNYGYTQEGADIYNYGVEGLSWERAADGTIQYLPHMTAPEKFTTENANYILRIHFAPKAGLRDTVCHPGLLADPAMIEYKNQWDNDPMVDNAYRMPTGVSLTSDETNKRAEIMNDLNTYAKEQEVLFINGQRDLSTFDTYMSQINSMGFAEAQKITQAAYDRYMANAAK